MRFLELDLRAFGPFTGRRLDLSGGEHGLHVVFGPNEAGKSSALRALKVLLFGFPLRSPDDFLHPYEQLRVGGRLLLGDGSEVAFLRRKGAKSTVLSPGDESPLDEGFLDRCLQGIEERHFSTLFGIDHEALVAGGRELLEQHGEVGQALFAAGLGSRSLRRVLESLDGEASSLFLPRNATKPLINQALAEYRGVRRELSDASLSGRDFEDLRKELERRREEADALGREIAGLERERNRLQRLRRALPVLAERQRLLARLGELEGAVVLPPDFPDRRREIQEALRKARENGDRAGAELAGLEKEAAALTVAAPVLAQEETIERLHQGVGRYAKDFTDRSRLLGESGELRAQAQDLLEEIRPGMTLEEAESLRPALDRWRRIQDLGNQRQALVNGLQQARRSATEAARALEDLREARAGLPKPRDPALLRRQVEAVRRAGGLDALLSEATLTLRAESAQLRVDLGRLGLWKGKPEELEALPVPPAETIERFGRDLAALAERRRSLGERRRAALADLAEAERRLEELRRMGAVPAESDLQEARERRDRGWRLLRRQWIDGKDVDREARKFDPDRPLPDAYERAVEEADELGDRLRRETGRVQLHAQLSARRDQLVAGAADLESDIAAAGEEAARLEAAWKDLWRPCGIDPLPPREMHAWTSRHEKLRDRVEKHRDLRLKLEALEETARQHRAALAAALKGLGEAVPKGEGVEPVLARSEEVVRRLEEEERQRARLEADVRAAETRLGEARREEEAAFAALEEWNEAWAEAIQGLGLGGDALPSEVNQLVESLRRISESRREAEKIERRLAGLDRDLDAFRTDVRALAAGLAPERVDQPPDQTAVHLHALLMEARRQADRREGLERRIEKLEREVRDAESTRRAMEERLAHLRLEAGCSDDAGLEEAERRSAEIRELRRDLDRCERQLLQEGEGATLDDLEHEVEGVDADALPGQIDQLGREIEERDRRLGDLREELGRRDRELEHRTGGDAAARAAEKAEEVLARLREGVDRYVRLRLAGTLLRREIERYRAENQAPLLRRAGELFATLTLGSFAGLQTDFDDRDEPVLVGVRSEGQRVRVEGMSDGARDQLYLALRLATLEKYLAHAEPLPFIVDDILINFDDARTQAALKVLADLAGKTQVILFTHHERLKEMAGAMRNGAGVFVRELG